LRFRAPQSLNSTWTSTIEATAYPKYCYGYGEDEVGHFFSEDCLYLNVFRPSVTENDNSTNGSIISNTTFSKNYDPIFENTTLLPVAVWIHGGGLFMGGTADQRYNMSFIIQKSINLNKSMMAVSIQYRLSAWGFLGGAEALEGGATNLGYRDQRLALHWVQENIAAFGGDPGKVTLWGESSGAESIGAQLLAYNGQFIIA
jgi:carboxylesterase type B